MQTKNRLPTIDTVGASIIISKAGQGYNPNRADIIIPANSVADEVYFNQACTVLNTTGGGRICVLDGLYTFGTASINMFNNIIIEGQGMNTIFKIKDAINAALIIIAGTACSNVKIRRILFDGNATNRVGGTQEGINVNNNCLNWSIEECGFTDIEGNCIKILNANYIKLLKNRIYNNKTVGSDIEIEGTTSYCIIKENQISSSLRTALLINNTTCTYNEISENIFLSVNAAQLNMQINGYRNNIMNNKIISGGSDGILLNASLKNNVSGNYIYGISSMGIDLVGNCLDNLVHGNFISSASSYGIRIHTSFKNIIENNYVYGSLGHGIYIINSDSNNIIGNICNQSSQALHNTYSNMILINSDDNNIQCNKCIDEGGAIQPQYGIDISDAGSLTNIVTNNDLKNSGATGSLHDIGTGTVTVAGNRL